MKLNYQISQLALLDLDEIWDNTAEHWSKQQVLDKISQKHTVIYNQK